MKVRLVRLGARALAAGRAHLRYIERDGVQRDGSPGQAYARDANTADGRGFLERCAGDRHQFRLIVSAEDGDAYEDLKPLVRSFIAQMERDLGTELDWIAVDHCDTAHPHSHVILRGRDDRGGNLIIARDYIRHGMRERLGDIVTRDLGPRQQFEVQHKLRQEVDAERLTSIDRSLLRGMSVDRGIAPGHRDPFRHALRMGRLKKLEALGLAEPLPSGRWRLAPNLEERLRRIGERGDIIRTMQRALKANQMERSASELAPGTVVPEGGLVGRILERGLADELADRHYLLVDGVDGRVHHVEIGHGASIEALPEGAVVRISRSAPALRATDRRIAEVAAASGGFYSADAHRRFGPSASDEYVRTHIRRLEAMRRSGAKVERLEDGSWLIPNLYLDEAFRHEQRATRRSPVEVAVLSPLALEQLPEWNGPTWLDRQINGDDQPALREAGFGREVRAALALRRQWLLDQRLAVQDSGELRFNADAWTRLRQRELSAAASRFAAELGKAFVEAREGEPVAGRLSRRIDLASGRFALLENSREFMLVPWRPVLEPYVGREIAGLARGRSISWQLTRARGLEI